ncbi:MAG: proline--tRNA ligase [Oscillospiraceae bacterium]|jgi:prolyl-tRNA synthetase|nr:proline--tRNA ligase [Oscillospiraceae bacterium]
MANTKNVEQITSMDVDFAQWYTDVVTRAELIDYSGVKGFFVLRPYGYAIWENIQAELDRRFKDTGHENVSMPLLISESLLQKEKDHVEGFAPECAWVTFGGEEELEERMCIRPTSETLFCDHWARTVRSWRDLPKLYNQWCSVLRWEKSTRPFLRHREFLWQEGHTLHATAQEAIEETERMLDVYADVYENILAMPVLKGLKTDKEKFAGAERTYTIECMMHDKKALQSCTSHYFGDGFARAFDITFADKENSLQYPFETSWGFSTRSIGGVIMTHGDDNGLVMPPRIAPVQIVVIPVASHKPGVLESARELRDELKRAGLRVNIDESDNSPGWKFAEHEMRGVPLRIEIGPRDIEAGKCVAVSRVDGTKTEIPIDTAPERAKQLLDAAHELMYTRAKARLDENTRTATTMDEIKTIVTEKGGFITTAWCGDEACEVKMKEDAGVTSRCIPFEGEKPSEICPVCGKKAEKTIVWGVAY